MNEQLDEILESTADIQVIGFLQPDGTILKDVDEKYRNPVISNNTHKTKEALLKLWGDKC